MCNNMSDVRLSNASPSVERVDARPQDPGRPPVRRSLFGPPDPAEVRRYLADAVEEGVRGFREEYNFDPVNDRPLTPRNYAWEEDGDAPEFYRRQPSGSRREAGGEKPGTDRRKRRSGAPGSCSSQTRGKRPHTDEDDDADAAAQAVTAAEEGPSRPEGSAGVP